MVQFLGPTVAVPEATADGHAVRKRYVDLANAALAARLSTVEGQVGSGGGGGGSSFRYRGSWTTTDSYVPGDVVTYGGQTFVCTTAVTPNYVVPDDPEVGYAFWDLWAAKGADATATSRSYIHQQVGAAAVWQITHNLGYDPGGITVISSDGYVADGAGTQYLTAGISLRLTFDISIAGTAYLS